MLEEEFNNAIQKIEKLRTANGGQGYNLSLDRALKILRASVEVVRRKNRRDGVETSMPVKCVYCDGSAKVIEHVTISEKGNTRAYQAQCATCGASGPLDPDENHALRKWNGVGLTFITLGRKGR